MRIEIKVKFIYFIICWKRVESGERWDQLKSPEDNLISILNIVNSSPRRETLSWCFTAKLKNYFERNDWRIIAGGFVTGFDDSIWFKGISRLRKLICIKQHTMYS